MNAIREALTGNWRPQRDRVLWAPVFLGVGVIAYFSLLNEPSVGPAAAAMAGITGGLLVTMRRWPSFTYPVFCVFLVMLGFTLGMIRTHMVAAPMLDRTINITRIEGRIVNVTVADDEKGKMRRRVTLDSLIVEKLRPEETPDRVRLATYHVPPDAVPGERVAMLARLMPPSGPVAPDGFNYRRQAFFEGLGAVGFTMGKYERLAPAADTDGSMWFNELRGHIARRIADHTTHPESAVAAALLAGERSAIPDEINDDLRDSGLYHLLSISGLHVAIVCGVTFFTLRFLMALSPFLALRWPIKKIAAAAAIGVGVFYVCLAGLPVPTQRSMLMAGIALLAVMLDRSALSIRTIALAAFFILLIQPDSILGASFQLSFAAVLAMVAFHEGVGRKFLTAAGDRIALKRFLLYFGGIAITTIIVSLATAPPVLYHFGRLQIFGVIANALAIPLTSFIVMPAGMLSLLAMPFGLEGLFLPVTSWGIALTLDIAHWVANLPHAAQALPSLSLGWYLVCMFAFLWLCLLRGRVRLIGLPVMVIAIWAGMHAQKPVAMIDADGRSLAVSGDGQVAYAYKRPTAFVRDNWLSLWGGVEANDAKPIRTPVWQSGGVAMSCDVLACRIISGPGGGVSVVRNANAMNEECNWARIIIAIDKAVSGTRAEHCAAELITFWDLRAGGGAAVYQDGDAWRARFMTRAGERRPWTM